MKGVIRCYGTLLALMIVMMTSLSNIRLHLFDGYFFVTALQENERVEGFYQRNYIWPPSKFVPDTIGWRRLHEHRLRQASEIPNRHDRYGAYLTAVQSGLLAPNFTEYGFGLTRAPEPLMETLRRAIHEGVANGPDLEPQVNIIEGDQPWLIRRPDLLQRVLDELHHIPEKWVNMDLIPNNAYGFRLYRNESNLIMHLDRPQTHIISFILHIDSSEDAEPWPILIEGFDGNTHEVILSSGDMLLYESSKCLHGRPHRFKGSWYSSVFVHYYPKNGWADIDHSAEIHYAVPPKWDDDLNAYRDASGSPRQLTEIPLESNGGGMKEPSCPHDWCASQMAIPFTHGPGQEGVWMGPTGETFPLIRSFDADGQDEL